MAQKTVVLTGSTSGIGYETALGLAKEGCNLILLGRQESALADLKNYLEQANHAIRVEYFVCDFSILSQVVAVSKLIAKAYSHIDILINNAGTWEFKKSITPEGFERSWAVNYFAPFLLTYHLMPILLNTAKTSHDVRIINVASEAHRLAKIDTTFSSFSWHSTYGATKLANVLHAFKLARDLDLTGITANAVHPGIVATKLWRRLPKFLSWIADKFLISPQEGAATTLALALTQPFSQTGQYYSSLKIATPTAQTRNIQLQDSLYAETLKKLAAYLI